MNPFEIQTGPAKRGDEVTKSIHLQLLDEFKDDRLKDIYLSFWKSIESDYI